MNAYRLLYALAVPPVLVLACGLFEWLGVPERVGAWLGGDRR